MAKIELFFWVILAPDPLSASEDINLVNHVQNLVLACSLLFKKYLFILLFVTKWHRTRIVRTQVGSSVH